MHRARAAHLRRCSPTISATGRASTARGGASRTDTGRQSVLYASGEQFTPEEEAEADRAAAKLLVVAWRGSNVGCMAGRRRGPGLRGRNAATAAMS
jgi:hypothetical protein